MSLKQRLFKLESQLKQKETVMEYVREEYIDLEHSSCLFHLANYEAIHGGPKERN